MDKIIVRGEYVTSCGEWTEIELSPPTPSEISKLKEGDEVLIKTYIRKIGKIASLVEINSCNDIIQVDSIVAILPQPQQEHSKQDENGNPIWEKPQQEFCECSGSRVIQYHPNGNQSCTLCRKTISPEPKPEFKIEELRYGHPKDGKEVSYYSELVWNIVRCMDKLNEFIRDRNSRKEK